MRWSLNTLEEVLGTSGPDLVVAVANASQRQARECAESVLAMDLCPPQTCDRLQVWPIVNTRMSSFQTPASGLKSAVGSSPLWTNVPSLGGLNPMVAADPRHSESSLFSRGVARALLYCHGLVLEDPLAVACAIYTSCAADDEELARRMLGAAARSAVEISQLVNDGIVVPYWRPSQDQRMLGEIRAHMLGRISAMGGAGEFKDEAWDVLEAVYVDGLHASLQEVWRRIRKGDRAPDLTLVKAAVGEVGPDAVSTFLDVMQKWRPEVSFDNVVDIVSCTLDDVIAMGGEIDFYAPAALFTRFLLATNPAPQDVDAGRVRELARTDVPGLDTLTWNDIAAMRRDEEAFALWRGRLNAGLQEAAMLRAQGLRADTRRCLSEALIEGGAALHRAQRSSTVLQRLSRSSVTFALGAVGGVVAGVPGGAVGATAGALGAGLSGALPTLFSGDGRASAWLTRHYVMFERPAAG